MKFEFLHPADQLVMMMDRIYSYGMTTTSGGNLSIMDDNGDIWITPSGIDKGSLRRQDICQVKPDGTIIGPHKPSIEYPFHALVYKKRPDVKAVLHAHPPALVAFSIVRTLPNPHIVSNAPRICGDIAMAPYAVPGSELLGIKIADEFAKGFNSVMLENHGVVVAAPDMFEAFKRFETLEYVARLEIDARRIGTPRYLTEAQVESCYHKQPQFSMNEFIPASYSSQERAVRREMCELINRSYNQQLFTSTQGTFSAKLDDGSFIITPYAMDRKYLESADLVRIQNGWREAGKFPSRAVLLHQAIYDQQPHVKSVMMAHPPSIMAFAVTSESFDSRTIPESYIMLRTIPKVPYARHFEAPEEVAALFGKSTPLAMIENDSLVVTGSSLLNAFDRLEVAEFSAKAIIASRSLGDIVAISDDEVKIINEAFHLD